MIDEREKGELGVSDRKMKGKSVLRKLKYFQESHVISNFAGAQAQN